MDTTHSSHISPLEWRRVAWFAALIIALVMLPYAVGWATQTDAMRFSGAVIAADDIHSYLGKMRLGARGMWDFTLFYTPEPHDPVPGVFLPYIAAGQLVGLFYGESDPALTPALIATYHAMRVAFTLLLIVVLYRFIAHFLRSPTQRMTALILSVVGGGFGWLLLFLPGGADWLGSLPPDLFIPEGFGFLIPLALPHLALVGRVGRWQESEPGTAADQLAADAAFLAISRTNPAAAQSIAALLNRPSTASVRVLSAMVHDRPFARLADLEAIACRALVLANHDDALHPIAVAHDIFARLPRAGYQLVPSRYREPRAHFAALREGISNFLRQEDLVNVHRPHHDPSHSRQAQGQG